MLRRSGLLVFLLAILTTLVATPAATAAAPYCGITWGSLAKSAPMTGRGVLVDIRSGRHACYDRLVFHGTGNVRGYHVSYVNTVRQEPDGHVLPLRGGAKLSITVNAPVDDFGMPYYMYENRNELVNVTGYRTFRQVAMAESGEDPTTVGLGVRARLPFRVFALSGRVVVDVAHRW
jgi:hypothetical protein